MRPLRDMTIGHKQMLIIMLTSGVVLLLACAAFAVCESIFFRQNMVAELTTLAEIAGNNTAGALDFNDANSATETLSALGAQHEIVGAAIYTKTGEVFAKYDRPNDDIRFEPAALRNPGHSFEGRRLLLSHPIDYKGETIGAIFLESDSSQLYSRLASYARIVGLVFLAAMLIAFFLSTWLQRLISGPIQELARVARSVALEKNYSVRAAKRSNDELGQLVDGFNDMLKEIQARDADLQAAQIHLEKRVEARTQELAHSLSLVNATLESATDGILVTDSHGNVTNFNNNFLTMWQISRDVVESKDETELLRVVLPQLKNPQRFLKTVQGLSGHSARESFDVLDFMDGRTFERYSKPQRVGEQCVGRVWNFRDITARKKSEMELENMHKELLLTSRQAGMAEVATSVLHNVGNVLNSVNISSSLVSEKVRKSKVTNLAKAVALIEAHAADIPGFFTNNPKGRQLPRYLSGLAVHLADEQQEILEELVSLNGNIEHIKEIVSMQQSYARISGVIEPLEVSSLVEDALRMNAGAMERHRIQVIREYAEEPLIVSVDKHKVLQILVNLIRNAKYALDEGMPAEKKVVLRVAAHTGETVRISVIDNGIGIPAENLTRIFGHGFTTRKDGHGFGLHSGALAARELGGNLTVHSEGPGKGATFHLEFPRQRANE